MPVVILPISHSMPSSQRMELSILSNSFDNFMINNRHVLIGVCEFMKFQQHIGGYLNKRIHISNSIADKGFAVQKKKFALHI